MIVDLYAGIGGWAQGAQAAGVAGRIVGIDSDADACATRHHAGHLTVRADATRFPPPALLEGLIASPPCQQFSQAGKGEALPEIAAAADLIRNLDPWDGPGRPGSDGVRHVLNVGAWIEQTRPGWIALEQVPQVLPLWEALADWLTDDGYSVWCGVLNAADFGVALTRRRAILIASRDRLVQPPVPTHAEHPQPDLWGRAPAPWVTIAFGNDAASWAWHKPATTIAGDPRITARCHHEHGSQGANPKTTGQVQTGDYAGSEPIRLTLGEALMLQGFPAGFVVTGRTKRSREQQVGNAMPPPFAAAVLSTVTAPALETSA